ncbi:MAG: hypothetical protein M3Y79_12000 [Pseudomonadota bacterium]|nr:hypothetical protein [Pseudomonadota bacterium]
MKLEGATFLQQLLGGAADIAGDYVRQELRVQLRSNVLPPVTLYSGGAEGGKGLGLGRLLGFKAGLVVTGSDGKVIVTAGQPAAFDPLRALLLAAALGGVVYLILRGVKR